jgi:hypothetical protein
MENANNVVKLVLHHFKRGLRQMEKPWGVRFSRVKDALQQAERLDITDRNEAAPLLIDPKFLWIN